MKQKSFLKISVFLIATLLVVACNQQEKAEPHSYTLVVSLDGFRWDYADHANTPTLDSIALHGVKANSLIPSFPTKTFPNHYSLATGLYPDNHGIVLNGFYAPDLDRYYFLRNRKSVEDPVFYSGEPIWVTAEKQGVKTASFYWVGSEAAIQGIQPAYWKKYQHDFPFEQRIDTVIRWFSLPQSERPELVMLYFHEPDQTGHAKGPASDSTRKVIEYMDKLLADLCSKLNRLPIAGSLNLIILSDHGMGAFDEIIFLDDYIDTSWFSEIQGWNPNYVFRAKTAYYDTAFVSLQKIKGASTWKHGELPARLHYGSNPRTLDFITVADRYKGLMFSWEHREGGGKGTHGYDNQFKDMHAVFYASGPSFKEYYVSPAFQNIHIYSLLAEILEIKPANTNGSIDSIRHILK